MAKVKIQIELSSRENAKVERIKHKFRYNSKIEAIKKIIREFEEK